MLEHDLPASALQRPVHCVTIGRATLYLGDCLSVIPRLSPVDAVFCDPPYSSGGTFRGDRTAKTSEKYQSTEHRGLYAEFSGDNRDQRSFGYWSALWVGACRERTREGGIIGMFTDWRQLPTSSDALQAGGYVWRGLAVWDKTEAARPQKGRYRNQCEYLVWGSNGPMSDEGVCAPGVLRAAVNSEEKFHIAGKPAGLLGQMLTICGDVVLDPFMGSGSTGVAAVRLGKSFVGIECDPHSFRIACERIEKAQLQGDLLLGAA